MTIWKFQEVLTDRLLRLNLINVILGLSLQRWGKFLGGVGTQAIGWGMINIAIAVIGRVLTRRRYRRVDDPYDPSQLQSERRGLRQLLLINAGLDVLYMLGGYHLAEKQGKSSRSIRGHGWGIIIQGALLLLFDLIHVFALPTEKRANGVSTRYPYTPGE